MTETAASSHAQAVQQSNRDADGKYLTAVASEPAGGTCDSSMGSQFHCVVGGTVLTETLVTATGPTSRQWECAELPDRPATDLEVADALLEIYAAEIPDSGTRDSLTAGWGIHAENESAVVIVQTVWDYAGAYGNDPRWNPLDHQFVTSMTFTDFAAGGLNGPDENYEEEWRYDVSIDFAMVMAENHEDMDDSIMEAVLDIKRSRVRAAENPTPTLPGLEP